MKSNKLLFVLIVSGGMVSTGFAMSFPSIPTPPSVPQMGSGINYAGGTPCFDERTGQYVKGCVKNQIQTMKEKMKQQVEQYKETIKQERTQIKEQIQQTRQNLKPTLKEDFKKLSTEIKTKLKQLRDEYLPQIKALKEKFKTATKEERQQILQQIQALREKLHSQIQQIASGTDYAQMLQQKWQKVQQLAQQRQQTVQNMKQQIQQVKEEFKQARADLVAKYKMVIYQKFQNKIDNMSLAKLQKVKERIEKAKERFEKMPLSDEMKTKIMSVLAALDEIITEKIEKLQQQEQSINTDDLLNNLLGN